jgi:hypothetical protein
VVDLLTLKSFKEDTVLTASVTKSVSPRCAYAWLEDLLVWVELFTLILDVSKSPVAAAPGTLAPTSANPTGPYLCHPCSATQI